MRRPGLPWSTFQLVETHAREPVHGGYLEAFARDWSPIAEVRLSPTDQNDPKSQNTLLHVMEAYTNLLRVRPEAVPERGDRGQGRPLPGCRRSAHGRPFHGPTCPGNRMTRGHPPLSARFGAESTRGTTTSRDCA